MHPHLRPSWGLGWWPEMWSCKAVRHLGAFACAAACGRQMRSVPHRTIPYHTTPHHTTTTSPTFTDQPCSPGKTKANMVGKGNPAFSNSCSPVPLTAFFKCGQLDFSKAFDSISDYQTSIFPTLAQANESLVGKGNPAF